MKLTNALIPALSLALAFALHLPLPGAGDALARIPRALHARLAHSLAQKGGTAARQISLPRGATVRMADGFLTVYPSPAAPEKAALTEGVPLRWGNFELTLLRRADGEGISLRALENSEAIFVAPCDLNARLTLEGANGARSVKRLCVDKKITPPERDALPAIYAGDRLAAVWRLGTDVSFLPQSEEDARFVRIVPL